MIYGILIFMHVVVSFLLVTVILLQSAKGGGLAGTFGGGVSTAMFGGQGADKLMIRLTAGLASAFMVLAILISMTGNPGMAANDEIIRQEAAQRQQTQLQSVTNLNLPEQLNPALAPLPAAAGAPPDSGGNPGE